MLILDQYKSTSHISHRTQSNKEYLATQVWQLKCVFASEISAIKDINLEYLAFSKPFAEAFKFNESFLDRPMSISNSIEREIAEQEQRILVDKVMYDSLYQFKPEPNIEMYLMRKRPLINPVTGDCVGISILAAKLDIAKQRRVVLKYFMGQQISSESVLSTPELTDQQQQIIACILLGFQQRKDIAKILENITDNAYDEVRIKNQLQGLYQKYKCASLNELVNLVVSNYKNVGLLSGSGLNDEIYYL